MNKITPSFRFARAIAAVGLLVLVLSPLVSSAANPDPALEKYQTAERIANEHLVKFDTLAACRTFPLQILRK